jgi:hypothetical protein
LARSATPLYLVHDYAVMPTIYRVTGDGTWESQSSSGIAVTWLLGALLLVPTTFWATSVFWRTVDVPCAKFVRWMEERVTDVYGEDMIGDKVGIELTDTVLYR